MKKEKLSTEYNEERSRLSRKFLARKGYAKTIARCR